MLIGRIEGATRVVGTSQGFLGLPIRDEKIQGDGLPVMVTAWLPTPEELAALAAGASVHVSIVGTKHPPIVVGVGEAP